MADQRNVRRWAMVVGVCLAVVVLLFVALRLIGVGGGDHGPGRHGGPGGSPDNTPSASVHTPPAGHR